MRKLTINIYGRLPAICEGVAYCLKRDLNVDAKFLDGNPESHPDDADLIIIQDRLKNPSCKTIDPRPGASTKFIALYEESYLSAHFLISQGFNCGLPVSRPLHELVRVIKKVLKGENLFWDGSTLCQTEAPAPLFDEQDFAIVNFLTKGYVASEISEALEVPQITLKNRIASLKQKLGAKTLIEACVLFKKSHIF